MKKKLVTAWRWSKAVVLPLAGGAVTLAAQGYFGPKAAAVAAGISVLVGVLNKRPQDPHTTEEEQVKALDVLTHPIDEHDRRVQG